MSKNRESLKKVDKRLELLEQLKKRLKEEARPDPSDPALGHVGDMTDRYPLMHVAMHAHLMEGGPSEGSKITLWGDDGGLGGVFSIPSLGLKMFFVAGSLQEALQSIEDALGDPDFKWKKERSQKRSWRPRGGARS